MLLEHPVQYQIDKSCMHQLSASQTKFYMGVIIIQNVVLSEFQQINSKSLTNILRTFLLFGILNHICHYPICNNLTLLLRCMPSHTFYIQTFDLHSKYQIHLSGYIFIFMTPCKFYCTIHPRNDSKK